MSKRISVDSHWIRLGIIRLQAAHCSFMEIVFLIVQNIMKSVFFSNVVINETSKVRTQDLLVSNGTKYS